ncbi:MAG: hypothetical protein WCE61_06465 [Candidatus Acidiferrum sp.]
MPNCMRALLALVFLFTFLTAAASKKKPPLPPAILHARTAIVLIDPNAGILVNAPLANTTAQDDVEKAIMNWGRLRLAQTVAAADLVITVRKGNGKIVQKTIGGVPTNDRPIVVQPNDTGIHIGAQQGHPPDIPQVDSGNTSPGQQTEIGPTEDTFTVYEGGQGNPLNQPLLWRYEAKNALHSPDVPAVAQFRKAIEEAEKQRQKKSKP